MINISVIMGDPSLPCIGKLNDTWNAEDIETRKKLVDAIYELGYQKSDIEILENHETLYNDLETSCPNFVFNLCIL